MHPRKFHVPSKRTTIISPDGVIKCLPVDQFNVKDFNINNFGHPKSDLTLLVEVTEKSIDNVQRFTEFASRIHMLKAEPKNNKTVDQLIHDWRPSWIQTVSEEQDFREWYFNTYEKELPSDGLPVDESLSSDDLNKD